MILLFFGMAIAAAVVLFTAGRRALIGRRPLPSPWAVFGPAAGMAAGLLVCRFQPEGDKSGNGWVSPRFIWQDGFNFDYFGPVSLLAAVLLTGAVGAAGAAAGAVVGHGVGT